MTGFDDLGPLRATNPGHSPLGRTGPRVLGDAADTADGGARAIGDGDDELSRSGFADHLADAVREVRELSAESSAKAEALASGAPVELHDLMIAMDKSQVAFNLMLEVRNRLLDAWQELSRTSV